ncbi:hypothetical protein [Mesorhizobium amorphae]|uniref:Uncharacterized protein n=1 Tax=Mesorhizobium amorphae CCNWGS0123 TaxID=1082933 RepID=G6YF56_9HYPH|nr:hypothetical protein [Mesorhizobium amorphae]ANT51357.1 hypothetical protein A6B35_16340 [Mesorhizobium amorphae CCNWGS0123]EHH09627.1 hypothetical protein MEA186_23006 [Mesorhizobium amorphae CCNWGS0123]GLR45184.1 hypothetical protein GCM10007880_57010 [Mesorhizobium amorphae]
MIVDEEFSKPKRVRSRPLVRHILKSDHHPFIGRVYDLGIVGMNFDSWDEVNKHPDCKYALEANEYLHSLASRVESLNLVGDLLWPEPLPANFHDFPVSRYEWLTIALDVFLVRYVSVVDCAALLTNQVFQSDVKARNCTSEALRKKGVRSEVIKILDEMLVDQGRLRVERNFRVHQGVEREFTQDGTTFRIAALLEHRHGSAKGEDQFGRRINIARFFKEALVELQRDFNQATRRLVRLLDSLYDELWEEFERRFGPLIRAATHGLNAGARRSHETAIGETPSEV